MRGARVKVVSLFSRTTESSSHPPYNAEPLFDIRRPDMSFGFIDSSRQFGYSCHLAALQRQLQITYARPHGRAGRSKYSLSPKSSGEAHLTCRPSSECR
jgi:hypothetical protein